MHLYKNQIRECATSEFTRVRFSSVQHEGIIKRTFKRIRLVTIKFLTATMLFSSAGNFYSCSQKDEQALMQEPTPVQIEKNSTAVNKTDAMGRIIFQSEEARYNLAVIDGETGKGIKGLLVILSISDTGGLYFILDPQNRYSARLVGVGRTQDGKTDSSDSYYVSNVVTFRKNHPCALATKVFGHVDFGSELDMKDLYEWNEAWLASDERGKTEIKNPLTANFYHEKKVQLKDLNDTIKQVIEFAIGEALETNIEVSVITWSTWLGAKSFAKALGKGFGTLWPLAILDACATAEMADWSKYYNTLCYDPNAEFDIWKLKSAKELGINFWAFDTTVYLTNPYILVIPRDDKNGWNPLTAKIKGKTTAEGYETSLDWGVEVYLDDPSDHLPSVSYPHAHGLEGFKNIQANTFFFIASACKTNQYILGIKSSAVDAVKGPVYDEPSMTLTVEEDKTYAVNFNLKKSCGTVNYKVKKVGDTAYSVSCSGNGFFDCDEIKDSVESTGGDSNPTKLKEIILNEVRGCLARDQNGNFYLGTKVTSEFSLNKFDEDLNVIWSVAGLGFGTSVISTGGLIYTLDSNGFIHQVTPSSEVLWKFDQFSTEQLAAVASDETLYAISSSKLSAINSGGGFIWTYNSPAGSELDTVAVNYDESIQVIAKNAGYLLTLDPNTGQELWKFKAPQKIHSDISILSDGTVVFGSGNTLYGVSTDNTISWEFSDQVPLNFTNPTANEDWGLSFVGWHPDCKESLLYLFVRPGISKDPTKLKFGFTTSIPPTAYVETDLNENGETEEINGFAMPADQSDSPCSPVVGLNGGIYHIKGFYSATPVFHKYGNLNERLSHSSWPMHRHDPQNTGNVETPLK